MSNQLTVSKLPAHLAHLASSPLANINQAASAGVSGGGWPRVSIKASRFRLQNPNGEEIVVPENYLDVIIVAANPHGMSKVFYSGAYDTNVDEKAPDCFSDNGVGPSSRAQNPQCGTCAACPKNAWGSKILPSGKQTKACSDYKKLAILIAANVEGPVFELRVPPASLTNFGQYINALDRHGIPASTVVTRLSFDTNADFPKIVFSPRTTDNGQIAFIDADQAEVVSEVLGTDEVTQCTGENDKPADPARMIAAPKAAVEMQKPLPPREPTPVQSTVLAAPAAPALNAEAPKRRGRRKAAETAASAAPAPAAQAAVHVAEPETPAYLRNMPASNGVVVNPPVTSASLDDLINKAMNA